MNSYETHILEQISAGVAQDDAAFADRITSGPRLSVRYKAGFAAATLLGTALVMMFSVHLIFGVAGYLVLVAAGTSLLRHRAIKPANESPLEFFHRLTAGLFRNTGATVEPSFD